MEKHLKPCPFCGAEAGELGPHVEELDVPTVYESDLASVLYVVCRCGFCSSPVPVIDAQDGATKEEKESVMRDWNFYCENAKQLREARNDAE